jgi:hypothetical protein
MGDDSALEIRILNITHPLLSKCLWYYSSDDDDTKDDDIMYFHECPIFDDAVSRTHDDLKLVMLVESNPSKKKYIRDGTNWCGPLTVYTAKYRQKPLWLSAYEHTEEPPHLNNLSWSDIDLVSENALDYEPINVSWDRDLGVFYYRDKSNRFRRRKLSDEWSEGALHMILSKPIDLEQLKGYMWKKNEGDHERKYGFFIKE